MRFRRRRSGSSAPAVSASSSIARGAVAKASTPQAMSSRRLAGCVLNNIAIVAKESSMS
jgi:hypothetical protein